MDKMDRIDKINISLMKKFFVDLKNKFEENLDELSALDAAIGDGDHGVTMLKGFRAAAEEASRGEYADINGLWSGAAKVLMKEAGGTCGPLFAAVFLKGGALANGMSEVGLDTLAKMFSAGNQGVKALGRASLGEKTMIDALEPAACALEKAAAEGLSLAEALQSAAKAAEEGAVSTKDMLATKGRGRYQGEKSLGHQDAGATSVAIIFKTLALLC